MIYLVENDTTPLDVTLNVTPALTGASVSFRMVKRNTGTALAGSCSILSEPLKQVRFPFSAGQLTPGVWDAEWTVTWPSGGGNQTIPNRQTEIIYVRPELD